MSADASQNRRVVLAVDDVPTNLKVIASTLGDEYEVKLAASGRKALDITFSQPPDLILLDVMMPEMDGYEVCRQIKSHPVANRVPVIFLTAKVSVEDEECGFNVGAVDFIHKPISPPVLRARVRAQLRLKDYERSLLDQNVWLQTEVERRIGDLLQMQASTVSVMISLAEFRDSDTGNHIIRVQKYVELLATELLRRGVYANSLTPALITQMVLAAPLHDIGKIAIPDSILLKPGPLDEAEWSIMKTHTERGETILRRCEESMGGSGAYWQVSLRIARDHHERWDGSGYPNGLVGESIPIEARIVTVADVYDALRTRRPYKRPMSHDDAIAQMQKGRGTQFDPVVLGAWIDLAAQVQEIATAWADTRQGEEGL